VCVGHDRWMDGALDSRLGWVRGQDDLLDRDDIVASVGVAKLQRVLARDAEVILDAERVVLLLTAEDAESAGARSEERENGGGDAHGGGEEDPTPVRWDETLRVAGKPNTGARACPTASEGR